ncbi:nuclease-related domain-containing protein [Planococcus sp. N028]|uniref:Nuclease-related domain-containing protein n=2 Tax=Planococcus shixiaomingii TaxID=3058393 RepID=A0ABT8MXF1_9BACL|nr:nuclease-related domain-containing protein [Planococcus sp. N028]
MRIKPENELLTFSESLKALLDRLPPNHPRRQFLNAELYREEAGKRGEKRIKRKFMEFYSAEEAEIIWDVRLQINDWKVQIDGLLLTGKGAVIIESKNISGKIHFDQETEEFYRIDEEGVKTIMENPLFQLEKHKRFMQEWFRLQKIALPVEGLVVFTSKKCEFISKVPGVYICKTYQMNKYLYDVLLKFPQNKASVSPAQIKQLIVASKTPFKRIPLCAYYHIKREELETGVYCQNCGLRTMRRIKKSWNCSSCKHRNKDAHIQTIREYFSLISANLDSRQFRAFCHIESPFVASRMLASVDLLRSGPPKKRVYTMKMEERK